MNDDLQQISDPVTAAKLIKARVEAFEEAAHSILSKHETASKSRVVSLDKTRRKLQGLSLQQEALLVESLDCMTHSLFRAAHVSAWQAFMDYLEEILASDEMQTIKELRPNWTWNKFKTMDDIRESIAEYQIIEVARDARLLSKGETKSILGHLSTRNQCAHPSSFRPDLNQSLGYVSGLIDRIDQLQAKRPPPIEGIPIASK